MNKLNNLFLAAVLLTSFSTPAVAGTKRKPANSPNIQCLNAVNDAFNEKWKPVHDMIRIEGPDLAEKERRDLHNESRRLLLAKADAIQTCNKNTKNVPLSKILEPFK